MLIQLTEPPLECSDSDVDERVRTLELERRRIETELALTVGEVDRRRSYLDDGHRSLTAYLRATCNWSDAEAARVRELLREFAPMLLDQAERLSFREFRTCVKRFVMLADLDGAHRDLGESITNPRTAAQRGYDAFVAIMRGALANHEAGRPAPATEPLVTILTDHRTWGHLLAKVGLAPDTTLAGEQVDPFTGLASPDELLAELMADPDSIGSRRCETSTGQILDPHTVLRAALAGHIRRAVLGADNLPINLGRKVRVFTGPARQAAKLLAVQCDHLGCGLPAELCQVDHSTEWSDDGPTDQANAGVECGSHNRLKHRKRWRTRRDIHGRTHTIRADGTIMLPVGVRPPVFPDASPPITPPEVERIIDSWANDAADDIERRCRTLRGAALRHASALDDLDGDTLARHLEAPDRRR